jgi:hypothetical protein
VNGRKAGLWDEWERCLGALENSRSSRSGGPCAFRSSLRPRNRSAPGVACASFLVASLSFLCASLLGPGRCFGLALVDVEEKCCLREGLFLCTRQPWMGMESS